MKQLLGAAPGRKRMLNSSNGNFSKDCDLLTFILVTTQGLVAFQAVCGQCSGTKARRRHCSVDLYSCYQRCQRCALANGDWKRALRMLPDVSE